jgi:hypothetical protein
VNEILINLNEKLIGMCDVRNMSYVTKQSNRFVCQPLLKSQGWHRTELYDNVSARCCVETWGAYAICQGIFRFSGWGVTVYKLYAVSNCIELCRRMLGPVYNNEKENRRILTNK